MWWSKVQGSRRVYYFLIIIATFFLITGLITPVCIAREKEAGDNLSYYLYFKELSSKTVKRLLVEAKLKEGDELPGGWQFISAEELSEISLKKQLEFDLSFADGFRKEYQQGDYYARLNTIAGEELTVRLGESAVRFLRRDYLHREDYFLEISLRPEIIDNKQERVFTHFEMEYLSPESSFLNRVDTWVSAELRKPLAFISREIEQSQGLNRKYYALYLAVVINDIEADRGKGLFPAADINGLNRLFSNNYIDNKNEYELSFQYDGQAAAVYGELENSLSRYQLGIDSGRESFNYRIGLARALYYQEDLFLSAILDSRNDYHTQETTNLYLGLSDKVKFYDLIELQLDFYPLGIDLNKGSLSYNPLTGAEIKLSLDPWYIRYTGEFTKRDAVNRLGAGYRISERWGIGAVYTKSNGSGDKLSLSFNWYPDF